MQTISLALYLEMGVVLFCCWTLLLKDSLSGINGSQAENEFPHGFNKVYLILQIPIPLLSITSCLSILSHQSIISHLSIQSQTRSGHGSAEENWTRTKRDLKSGSVSLCVMLQSVLHSVPSESWTMVFLSPALVWWQNLAPVRHPVKILVQCVVQDCTTHCCLIVPESQKRFYKCSAIPSENFSYCLLLVAGWAPLRSKVWSVCMCVWTVQVFPGKRLRFVLKSCTVELDLLN